MTIEMTEGYFDDTSRYMIQPLLIEQLSDRVCYGRRRTMVQRSVMVTSLVSMTVILLTHVALSHTATLDIYKNARLGHRIVQTRYGRLHGLILPLDNYRFLRAVEVFLGVPYATPPTKQNR